MAYLPGEVVAAGKYNVHCMGCGVVVGVIAQDDILPYSAYIQRTKDVPYCFECDSVGADAVSPLLIGATIEFDGMQICLK